MEIKVNGKPFRVNERFDKVKLTSANIKKAGFFARRLIKVNKSTTLYWAKNCTISFFNDELTIAPNLDATSGADMMYGTSCYFFYSENQLWRITAQIIKNVGASLNYAEKFKEIASIKIGEPEIQKRNEISGLDKFVKWTHNESVLLYDFNDTFDNVYFHLLNA